MVDNPCSGGYNDCMKGAGVALPLGLALLLAVAGPAWTEPEAAGPAAPTGAAAAAPAGAEGETATKPQAAPRPEAAPKGKGKSSKKRTKTKKETAEERYRRSKYYAIMPAETSTYKFSSERKSSGKGKKKDKKGKKGQEASKEKTCGPEGAACSADDGCGCCRSRIDCEELPDCQWEPAAGEGSVAGAKDASAGKCLDKAAGDGH